MAPMVWLSWVRAGIVPVTAATASVGLDPVMALADPAAEATARVGREPVMPETVPATEETAKVGRLPVTAGIVCVYAARAVRPERLATELNELTPAALACAIVNEAMLISVPDGIACEGTLTVCEAIEISAALAIAWDATLTVCDAMLMSAPEAIACDGMLIIAPLAWSA